MTTTKTRTWWNEHTHNDYGYGTTADSDMMTGRGVLTIAAAVLVTIAALAYFLLVPAIYAAERHNCDRFARETGYTTEWKHTGFGASGCYVLTPSGWVNRDNLIGTVEVTR